ncbi:cytochrome b [Rhizobium subbaraonis]|uniref:Cytochrome b n=1 Tax=Rhizobium subbaraonis TaxID=908946 RepID=A0A285UQT9_9HYPH|nr:cytochrome b/b6 domain-containing protein [Rhizobium subbaraonis]SOC44067.1 cytochrome b [Rhizobium subbaraonis]
MPGRETKAAERLPTRAVRVWDPFVRISHWSMVALLLISYLTGDEWRAAHLFSGYVIMALLLARVVWGFFGSRHARFSDFAYPPRATLGFLVDALRGRARRYLGHNPAGGAMILALLFMIAGIATTGYMMTTDAYWGVEWVEIAHETFVNVTLGLVCLHVAGVVLASIEHRENLVGSMVTGSKRPLEEPPE